MLSHVFDSCNEIQTWPQFMAGTPQSKRRTTWLFEKPNDRKRRSGTDGQNDETCRESHLAINWSGAWVRYLDHIAKIDIFHTAPHLQRNRYNNQRYLRSVDGDEQAPSLQQRPGYQDAKKALVDMHKQVRQDRGVTFIPKVEWQRLRNQIDPSMQRYLEWLSTDWAEYFAEERPQPTSSSSLSPSSPLWTSSSWTSDWHQHEWKDSEWSEW